MTLRWEKVYVFISSTFNDMHAERDYLVKQVFPRLAEWCERRKLRLVDIDLRWGVTEADATQNKRVVQVCLERIDACRPFFLCFMGQRRGWVPSTEDISSGTFDTYPNLKEYVGDTSVTELEILHALVNPLHRGRVVDAEGTKVYTPAECSFFYLRGPEYLAELPSDVPGLREVYTNEGIADPEARRHADEELERWRERKIPATRRPVHAYAARWDAVESTPELRLPLDCPSTAERDRAAWQVAYERWARQWAQAGVRVDEDTGSIADLAEQKKAERFNDRLTAGRLTAFTCDGEPLAEIILADLQAAILARYPDRVETAEPTPLQRELDQQEQFLQSAGEGFIERVGDFAELDRYLHDDESRPFILTAPGGLGKTSLLAHWIDSVKMDRAAGESLRYRFIGMSDGSSTVDAVLRSVLSELQAAGNLGEEIPADPAELRNKLPRLLAAAGQKGRTVIVLDGLNQLETGLRDIGWLPLTLPPGVRLVASFKRGEPRAEAYLERLRAGGQAILTEVKPFESLDDRRKLVRTYLSQFLKELDERHLEALIHSEGAGNPLFLKVVLAELRVFGAFGNLGEKIRRDFGTTPVSAFDGLLRRLEADPAYSPRQPEELVPRLFGWLAHARMGLSVEELGGLLVREGLLDDDEAGRRKAAEAVLGLLRQVRPYLARREGRADFFYESFKAAAQERYVRRGGPGGAHPEDRTRTARVWHAALAEYFEAQPLRLGAERAPNRHTLAELAYQQACAGMAEPLQRTLWAYRYVEARLEGSDVQSLIADYDLVNRAEAGLESEARRRLRLLQAALRLSAHVLGRDVRQLPSQLTGRLLGFEEDEIQSLLEQARREVRGPWLRPLAASLTSPGGPLVRTLSGHRDIVYAVAVTSDGRRAVSGSKDKTLKLWDLESGVELASLHGHAGGVMAIAVTHDGRRAVSGSDDHTLRVWDLEKEAELAALRGHTDWVSAVALTPDGRRAVSGSMDKTLKVWDLECGVELAVLHEHLSEVTAVAVTPDGRRVVSGSRGGMLKVWDLESGAGLATLSGHTNSVKAVAVTPDGRRAVSGSLDKTLKVWDLASGSELVTLRGHRDSVHAVAVTFDGRTAVSGSYQELRVWDLESGAETATLYAHSSFVRDVAATPNRRWVISASNDQTLKVWDLESRTEPTTQRRHALAVGTVAATPDGRRAISGSDDHTLKVWNLESGGEAATLRGHSSLVRAVAVTADGRRVVSGSEDDTLRVWDLESGAELATLRGHRLGVEVVAVTPDGRRAVSGSGDCTLKVWDLAGAAELATLRGHGGEVWAVAVTPDGRWVVSGSRDQTLRVWDLEGGVELAALRGHSGSVKAVAVTPDGRRAVSGSSDNTLKVWDLEGGTELRTLNGHTGPVYAVALTPDGRRAVSGSEDCTLRVWDLESWAELAISRGHAGWVRAVAVTPDGRWAVSGSEDHTLKVCDLESAAEVAAFGGEGSAVALTLCPDGVTIVAGAVGGQVHLIRLEGLTSVPLAVAAWRAPDGSVASGCPHCRVWSEVPESALDSELACPHCGKVVKLNRFVIKADWRPVAAAWKGENH